MSTLSATNIWARLCSENEQVRRAARDEYLQWKGNPITEQVVEVLEALRGVAISSPCTDDQANNAFGSSNRLGLIQGVSQAIDRMSNMAAEADDIRLSQKAHDELNRTDTDTL